MVIKLIRNGVFETNSSSTHSISISEEVDKFDTLYPDDGVFTFTGGEFGWEWESYTDAYAKANYVATFIDLLDNMSVHDEDGTSTIPSSYIKLKTLFEQVIKDHVGCEIKYDMNKYSDIDYQSIDVAWKLVDYDYDTLKNFIFNPKSILYTGNDNDGMKWENGRVVRNR